MSDVENAGTAAGKKKNAKLGVKAGVKESGPEEPVYEIECDIS